MRFMQGHLHGLGWEMQRLPLGRIVVSLQELWGFDRAALDESMTIGAWRTQPRRKPRSIISDTRDHRILHSLSWAGFLSTSQIERLHFPSRRTAQRRLRALLDHGFVRAALQGTCLHLQNVYTLTTKGGALLESRGVTRVRPRHLVRAQKLRHALAVRDVFVAFSLAEQAGTIHLDDFRFEDDLAKEPVFQSVGIIPDALALVRRQDAVITVGCEVDLGSETGRMLRSKCGIWADILRSRRLGPIQLLIVVAGVGRADNIRRVLNEVGCSGVTTLLDSVITQPLGILDCLYARGIRAERMGSADNHMGFRVVDEASAGAFRIFVP